MSSDTFAISDFVNVWKTSMVIYLFIFLAVSVFSPAESDNCHKVSSLALLLVKNSGPIKCIQETVDN